MEDLTFSCPVCGADVLRKAKSCPDCGACEKSGWSEDQYLDGINLPDPDDTAVDLVGNGARPDYRQRFWWFVAVVILAAFLLLTLRGMW
jgi:hypothetical protein